jgi:tetratricopeptide (TPR) repeat protein
MPLTGAHLWADRYDGGLEDIFDLQDQVTASVVAAIAPKVEQAEIGRAQRKPTESLVAYDYYLRGIAIVNQMTREANEEALRLFYKGIELDPDFASAYGMAAWCYVWRKINAWTTDPAREIAETRRLAERAAELGRDDAVALSFAGWALAYIVGDLKAAVVLIDRALVLNPNLAAAWTASGWARAFLGKTDTAIEHLARAMRINPLDPLIFSMQGPTALAHLLAGRYDAACYWSEKAVQEQPNFLAGLRMVAISYAFAERLEEAREAIARARQLDPELRISNLKDRIGPFRPEDLAKYVEGLRKAGLPE